MIIILYYKISHEVFTIKIKYDTLFLKGVAVKVEKKEYLNEESFQKNKKKIIIVALLVLIIGSLIGGSLIVTGLMRSGKINLGSNNLTEQIETEKQQLVNSKTELETKIKPIEDEIKNLERKSSTGFDDAYYEREDKIEELEKSITIDKNSIEVINNSLDESFDHCAFDKTKKNPYTSNYCSLKNKTNSYICIVFYAIGAFVIFSSCMMAGFIYFVAKRREILAFTTQQAMPVAQEGIEKIAPAIGNAAGTIAKSIKDNIKEEEK